MLLHLSLYSFTFIHHNLSHAFSFLSRPKVNTVLQWHNDSLLKLACETACIFSGCVISFFKNTSSSTMCHRFMSDGSLVINELTHLAVACSSQLLFSTCLWCLLRGIVGLVLFWCQSSYCQIITQSSKLVHGTSLLGVSLTQGRKKVKKHLKVDHQLNGINKLWAMTGICCWVVNKTTGKR